MSSFVEISIRRREANLRCAMFGACAYVAQLGFVVLALSAGSPVGFMPLLTSKYFIFVGWIGVPVGLAILAWFRRKQRAELARLRVIGQQLQGD